MFRFGVAGNIVFAFFNLITVCLIKLCSGISPCTGKFSNGVMKFFIRLFFIQETGDFLQRYEFFSFNNFNINFFKTLSKFEIYDRILSINGQEVTSEAEYYVMISKINKGETAAVKVKRGFGTVDIAITFK